MEGGKVVEFGSGIRVMCSTRFTLTTTKSLKSCPTRCDPRDGSPPGSPIPGLLQARTLEWVARSFPNSWKWKVKVKSLSHVRPSATPWTAGCQAPPPMGFSRQEYWSGVPLPQAKQLTGREHSPTYHHTIGVKSYWAWLCIQSKTNFPLLLFPTASSSH